MEDNRFDNLITSKSSQRNLLLLIIAAFSVESIIRYVVIAITKLPIVSFMSGAFKPLLFIWLILINFKSRIAHSVKQADITFVLLYFGAVLVSFVMYPDTQEYVLSQKNIIFLIFPLYYLFGVIFTSDRKTMDILAMLAKLIIFVDIVFSVYWTSSGNELGEDSMARAYAILPSVLFLTICAFNRSKSWDWAWMIFSSIYIFTCGTRGPIIVITVFLIYCLIIKMNVSKGKKVFYVFAIIVFFAFYNSIAFENIMHRLIDLFGRLGVSTRIFEHMVDDTLISDSSGRDLIYVRVLQLIKENPFGYGILGEYPFLNWNTHNLYLQIFMHFGVFVGLVIIFAIFYLIYKAYKYNPNKYARDFLIMWTCITLVRGVVGGSYLTYYFAFLIGLCVNEIRNKKGIYKTEIFKG